MRWERGLLDRAKHGLKDRVAECMAEGMAAEQISAQLHCSIHTVYAYFAAIKNDLGPQARANDLGWRGGHVWHRGVPLIG